MRIVIYDHKQEKSSKIYEDIACISQVSDKHFIATQYNPNTDNVRCIDIFLDFLQVLNIYASTEKTYSQEYEKY